MKFQAYPLSFQPVYQDYIWGGGRIPGLFGRKPRQGTSAESWEISDRPEGMSVVRRGPLAGSSLAELVENFFEPLAGSSAASGPRRFPLLIKIIDAGARLSVQVHPNDETAALHGGEAKTEMWYSLHAEPGSKVYVGLKKEAERNTFIEAIKENSVEKLLQPVEIAAGKSIYVPGGRVHAICENNVLLEIQQNSNTTYRVYDWGRVGNDGKPRELHVEQALKVINWNDSQTSASEPVLLRRNRANSVWSVVESPYFKVERLDLSEAETFENDGSSFHALFVETGKASVFGGGWKQTAEAGDSLLIPASLSEYEIMPADGGSVRMVRSRL